jgi:hypothetical protein
MPKIGRNDPCLCGEAKSKFKNCHGKTEKAFAEFKEGMHEIGHAAMLPKSAQPHVSFCDPCQLCSQDESTVEERKLGQTIGISTGAHTSYTGEFDPLLPEFILYSIMSGAAEVACGLEPTLMSFEDLGQFPASMGFDLQDLKEELPQKGLWEESHKYVKPCFDLAVREVEKHIAEFRKLALELIKKRTLVGDDLTFQSFRREELVEQAAELMGPEVVEAVRRKFKGNQQQKGDNDL